MRGPLGDECLEGHPSAQPVGHALTMNSTEARHYFDHQRTQRVDHNGRNPRPVVWYRLPLPMITTISMSQFVSQFERQCRESSAVSKVQHRRFCQICG